MYNEGFTHIVTERLPSRHIAQIEAHVPTPVQQWLLRNNTGYSVKSVCTHTHEWSLQSRHNGVLLEAPHRSSSTQSDPPAANRTQAYTRRSSLPGLVSSTLSMKDRERARERERTSLMCVFMRSKMRRNIKVKPFTLPWLALSHWASRT